MRRQGFIGIGTVAILGVMLAGCGGGGGGGNNGAPSGGVVNTLPYPNATTQVRAVHAISTVFNDQKYRLQVDGTTVTEAVSFGESATSGNVASGSRHITVLDSQMNTVVSGFDRFLSSGVTTVFLFRPPLTGGTGFSVTALDANQVSANSEFAGVRLVSYASHAIIANPDTELFTFVLTGPGTPITLTGQKYGAPTSTNLPAGTFQVQVKRADGTVLLNTPVTIPEAKRRYTLILLDDNDSDTGIHFQLLTDQ